MTLSYGVCQETGFYVSWIRDHPDHRNSVAWPVLDYESIGENGDYTQPFEYNLEEFDPVAVLPRTDVRWTRKIPIDVKNLHREFWGLKPLKVKE